MKLIRCPYCGAEFTKKHIQYVGADPQLQVITGLFFAFFAVNALLIHAYSEAGLVWFALAQLGLGIGVVVRGVYKYVRARRDFLADIRRHLGGHRRSHRHHSRQSEQQSVSPIATKSGVGSEGK